MSVAFYLRNHLTKTSLGHHLKILKIATNSNLKEHNSSHNLLSKYSHLKADVEKILICPKPNCQQILVLKNGPKCEPTENQPCGHKYTKKSSNCCFILRMPIDKQISYFIEHHGISSENGNTNPDVRGDVNTGGCYKNLREEGLIDDHTITLQLNTDGAQGFKMSKYGFWPLMGIINEAPYKLRRNYVVLLSLWYGNKKNPTEPYLEWAMDELKRLQIDGIIVKEKKYFVRVLIATTDTVARPLLRNTTQYNGLFGCDICLHPGILKLFSSFINILNMIVI